ncbi:hypothetical protein FB451DRAFT_1527929 [Mycena latifolia]|nr:hypothetical protein FB451DRAFT_1527929 [Mycena latifolia]
MDRVGMGDTGREQERAREGGHGERVHGVRDTHPEQNVADLLRLLAQVVRGDGAFDPVRRRARNRRNEGKHTPRPMQRPVNQSIKVSSPRTAIAWEVLRRPTQDGQPAFWIAERSVSVDTPVPARNARESDSEDGVLHCFHEANRRSAESGAAWVKKRGSRNPPPVEIAAEHGAADEEPWVKKRGSRNPPPVEIAAEHGAADEERETRPHTIHGCSVGARRGHVQRDSAAHANPTGNMPVSLHVRHGDVSRPGRIGPQHGQYLQDANVPKDAPCGVVNAPPFHNAVHKPCVVLSKLEGQVRERSFARARYGERRASSFSTALHRHDHGRGGPYERL